MMGTGATGETIHATTVAIDGMAVLIMGPSGSGKSDLALRLIDRGARLVSDDYTIVTPGSDGLIATAPPTIAGKLEVRGVGIIDLQPLCDVAIALAIRLDGAVERLPAKRLTLEICGLNLPAMNLAPFEASAPIKVELMLRETMRAGPS